MKKLILALTAAMATGVAMAVTIAYQGALKNADGSAISGGLSIPITFRLYDSPTSDDRDAVLWGRTVSVLLNDEGLFNVELSDGSGSNPDPIALTNKLENVLAVYTENLYIGLYVENSTGEIRPRQKLLSVPMAAYAQDVSKAKNDFTVRGRATVGMLEAKSAEIDGPVTVTGTLTASGKIETIGDLSVSGNLLSSSNVTLANKASLTICSGATLTQDGEVGGIVPRGGIIMWSGSATAIPKGWALCNGQTIDGMTTPNLTGRFVVGASADASEVDESAGVYPVDSHGGANAVALKKNQMPNHYHLFPNDDSLYKRDAFGRFNDGGYYDNNAKNDFDFSSDGSNDDYVYKTGTAGGDATDTYKGTDGHAEPHQNLPPYYALCYIIKL